MNSKARVEQVWAEIFAFFCTVKVPQVLSLTCFRTSLVGGCHQYYLHGVNACRPRRSPSAVASFYTVLEAAPEDVAFRAAFSPLLCTA